MPKKRSIADQLRGWVHRESGSTSVPDHELDAIATALSEDGRRPLPPDLRERLLSLLASLRWRS